MSDAFEKLKPGRWYWIAGKGPMKFSGDGSRFLTFAHGFSYWASADEVGGKCNRKTIARHFEETCRVHPVDLGKDEIEYLKGRKPDETLGEVSDHAANALDVFMVRISRYGVPITVGQLLAKIGETSNA